MRLLRRLEQTLGRFAVPNLTLVLIACQVLAFAMTLAGQNGLLRSLAFIPADVLQGEIWRLITFLTIPPSSAREPFAIIWAFFFWYILYLVGTTLENDWGVFRFNVYLFIWYAATVATAFLTPQHPTTNVFLETSLFVAFAYLYPNVEFRLFLILPVKVKWLAWLAWFLLGFTVLTALVGGEYNLAIVIAASFANYFLFFGRDLYERILFKRRRVARQVHQIKQKRQQPAYHHRCAVCGKTDVSDPDEDFRYCSRCSGQYAYCSKHLREHEHVRDGDESLEFRV